LLVREKQLVGILSRLYPSIPWPKPFNLLKGQNLADAGKDLREAAREVGTNSATLGAFCRSTDKIGALFGSERPDEDGRKRVRQILGNLIVGHCAEIAFEEIYKNHTHATELELRDLREGRSDTDY